MITIQTEYLQDTWRFSGSAPFWGIEGVEKYATLNSKEQYQELLIQTFKSFEGLIFPLEIRLIPHHTEASGTLVTIEKSSQSMAEILTTVQEAISDFEVDIYEIQIDVAFHVYCKTKEEGIKRVWLDLKDEFVISAGKEDPKPNIYLSLAHLLFNPDTSEKKTNNLELYRKNQPLLEQALRNWEQSLAPITEYEGYGPVFQYGILEEIG